MTEYDSMKKSKDFLTSVKFYDIDEKGKEKMFIIEKMLEDVSFQTSGHRRKLNITGARPTSMPFGMKKELNGDYALPTFDKQNPEIYPFVRDFINEYVPDFDFNAGYINKNVQMIPHKDKNNVNTSLVMGLGDYEGGELFVEGTPYDIKYKIMEFDGKREEHWTSFFKGTRYSVILYKI